MDPVAQMTLVVGGLLLLGAIGEFVFSHTGIPDVVWLVAAGILLGPTFGIVSSEVLQPAVPFFGAIALTVILSGGAYRLQLREVVTAAPRGLVLGMLGFLFSIAAICVFLWLAAKTGHVSSGPLVVWVMIGAIVAGTSAVVIMPTVAGSHMDARVARILEVESSATDALCVVMTMVLIDLIVSGRAELTRPFVSLGRDIGVGVGFGVVAAALLMPLVPTLRDKPHGYTIFLASMLALYALTQQSKGNGAVAVLTGSILIGNASTIVPSLIPGARAEAFVASEVTGIMQEQMTFLIKSFFFVLIGLMFPTTPRLIALGGFAALLLLLFRIPAVGLSLRGLPLSRKHFWLLVVAIPRGLAAGVLSTLPLHYGVPGVENLSAAVFALIVFSILIFAGGFSLVGRIPSDDPE